MQALTRVNRTYKNFRYGYVVDFADISQEFDATNKAYFEELQAELGDEMANYSQLFKSQEEIRQEIEHIKDVLFQFDTENAEIFSDQINEIQERETALLLKNALADARSLYNVIRLQGDYDFLTVLDFNRLNVLYRVASARLDLLNLRENLEQGEDISGLLNRALEDVIFEFVKVGEEELVLADKLKQTLRRTREALANNFDQQDPHFITLKEELERLFKKKKLSDVTQNEMVANIGTLNRIHANNSFLPSYLGYFFVALSVGNWETLWFVYGVLFIFTFLSQALYFNPLFLIFGYEFYNVKTKNGTAIFLISRQKYKTPSDIYISTAFRINNYTFIERS